MRGRIYLRIGKVGSRFRVDAGTKPKYDSLYTGTGNYNKQPIPTVLVALDLDIDDREFDAIRVLLETRIEHPEPAIHIRQVLNDKPNQHNLDREI